MEDKIDKLYDLIGTMHTGLTQQIGGLTNQVKGLSCRVDEFAKEQRRQGIIIDSEIRGNIKALFDGYKQTYEGVMEVKADVSALKDDMAAVKADVSVLKDDMRVVKADVRTLASGLEKQEVEIRVIKGGK